LSTAAALLIAQGVPINVVSQILGHANPTITLNVYAKVLKSQQLDAAQKMNDLLFGGMTS
jgi:integrase